MTQLNSTPFVPIFAWASVLIKVLSIANHVVKDFHRINWIVTRYGYDEEEELPELVYGLVWGGITTQVEFLHTAAAPLNSILATIYNCSFQYFMTLPHSSLLRRRLVRDTTTLCVCLSRLLLAFHCPINWQYWSVFASGDLHRERQTSWVGSGSLLHMSI